MNSIRLLRILPDLAKNGLIQCDLWHTTTNSEFSCFSYAWGEEIYEQPIFINGKSFVCRTNLWSFLQLVRDKFSSEKKVFWTDGNCIDQSSISERNHQVGLMGGINSKATDVLAWFGPEDKTKVFLDLYVSSQQKRPRCKTVYIEYDTAWISESYAKAMLLLSRTTTGQEPGSHRKPSSPQSSLS